MSAGTLTLTNNSDLVSGAGTSFSTELTAGDFVVVTVGGVTYTLPVKSVEGDTEITLISKYPGPTQQGSAWNAVPRATQNRVTSALVAQSTEALRGLNYDKQNWQAVFSASGNITVFLPDGSSFSGPSWKSIAETLSTLDVDYLNQLAAQINQDAQQVETDKNTVVETATQVSADAQAASAAATGAQGSASDAAESETNAEGYKELARKYALNPEDNPVTGSEYSALHYSEKARKSAEDAASHNPAEALVKSLNLSDLADRAAAWLNVRPIGSTPLAGDAVNPYDAPTLRQVENMVGAGGGLGPTLNGVQNFGVGQPALWTSRAFIPAWSVVADGQILNRADWPELWAHAQMHTPISDADWLANPGKRGNYSDGDGATTFRVPDFNGVQSGSIPGLFGRGDQGGLLPSGNVYESAAPDIAGTLNFRQVRAPAGELNNNLVGSGGAFSTSTGTTGQYGPISLNGTLATALQLLSFKASDSNPVYGRSANQVWPNSFVGVWIIRASGGFTAANTSWTVYNGDDVAPPVNTTTNGGAIRSEYQIGGTMASALSLTAQYIELASGIRARAQLAAASANDSYLWWFNSNGDVVSSDGRFHYSGVINPTGNVEITGDKFSSFIVEDRRSADADGVGKWWSFALDGNYGAYFIKRRRNGVNTGQIVINMPSASGTIALQGTSGLAYKHSVKDADLAEAVGRIDALRMVNFVYNDDEQNRERFGFIAEEAEQVAPQYIKHNSEPTADILDKDGNKIGEETRDRPSVDNNPIVMDLLGYVKHLKAEIEMLKTALNGK